MKATRIINNKNQKGLLIFCLFAWFSASPSFAQTQEKPAGQQTQQAPSPTATSTPSGILVEAGSETPAQLTEKQSTLTYGAEMDFNSNYVWRGLLLDGGPVGQPSAWISAFGFTLTAWSNVAMTNTSGSSGLQSGGLTLTFNRDWEKLKIEAALDAYAGQQMPEVEAQNTMEGSLKLSYPAGPLRVFTTHAFDVLAYRGSYFGEAGLEYARPITKNTEFTISVRSGWASAKFNDVYIGVNKSAFNLVGVEGSLVYYLGPRMYFRPHVQFSSITDRRLREQLAPANIISFGLAFGFTK
jgi:MltA-interacting protein MipA